MLRGTSCASLLGNILKDNGTICSGEEVIRAGEHV